MTYDVARVERMKNLYVEDGLTMQQIANEYGISRERVRQLLKRIGIKGRDFPAPTPPEEILAALEEESSLLTHADVAAYLEVPLGRIHERMNHAPRPIYRRIKRQFALNRRESYLEDIREVARSVGHTPTADELLAAGVQVPTLQKVFGSLRAAQAAAGFHPNPVGRAVAFRYHRELWSVP